MSALLVTGGAGFIGANFVSYWREHHSADRIMILDAMTYAAQPASLAEWRNDPRVSLVLGNICDQALVEKLLTDEDIKRIAHFAAESHVDRSISGPDPFIETNITGTHSLLKAARNCWSGSDFSDCRFHHISTDEVYGSLKPDEPPFTESSQYAPNSTYSASKAASDHLVRAYNKTYGLPVTTSNCSNNFGPLQFPEKLIPLAITNLLNGKPVPIYGDGRNIRDWLHVEDHCRGIDAVLNRGEIGHTYNLGGDCELANIDLVQILCGIIDGLFAEHAAYAEQYSAAPPVLGAKCGELITYVDDRLGHDRRYAIDATKTKRELGFSPEKNFEQALAETAKWYLDNPDWWRPILDDSYRVNI